MDMAVAVREKDPDPNQIVLDMLPAVMGSLSRTLYTIPLLKLKLIQGKVRQISGKP